LDGYDIEMEGREIFQGRIGCFEISVIDRLDIVMTLIAEIDTAGLFSLTIKILQGSLLLVAAGSAGQPIDPPLIPAIGAKGITHSPFSFQKIQVRQATADGAVSRSIRLRFEFAAKLLHACLDRRPDAVLDQE
jgi:hypothetical protein